MWTNELRKPKNVKCPVGTNFTPHQTKTKIIIFWINFFLIKRTRERHSAVMNHMKGWDLVVTLPQHEENCVQKFWKFTKIVNPSCIHHLKIEIKFDLFEGRPGNFQFLPLKREVNSESVLVSVWLILIQNLQFFAELILFRWNQKSSVWFENYSLFVKIK